MDYRILYAAVLVFAFAEAMPFNASSCPDYYLRFSTKHSYCVEKNPRCEVVDSRLTQEDKDQAVDSHNKYRSIIANQQKGNDGLPGASDMLLMEWDEELAQIAQNYAYQCRYKHDEDDARRSRQFSDGVGQNIYEKTTDDPDEQLDMDDAVGSWYSEIQFFEREMICKWNVLPSAGVHGHFTQVVWARSFRVGCGYVLYKHGSKYKQMVVCNYGQLGNMQGDCVYETGSACSNCPANTECTDDDSEYPGLCERTDSNKAPYWPYTEKPLRFDCNFNENCEVGLQGKGSWKTISAIGGYYLEGILQPGESGTIIFDKTFSGNQNMCAVLRYRRGPNLAKDTDYSHSLIVYFNDADYELDKLVAKKQRHSFSKMSLAGVRKSSSTKVKITFSVPDYADSSQFFGISSLIVYEGQC